MPKSTKFLLKIAQRWGICPRPIMPPTAEPIVLQATSVDISIQNATPILNRYIHRHCFWLAIIFWLAIWP